MGKARSGGLFCWSALLEPLPGGHQSGINCFADPIAGQRVRNSSPALISAGWALGWLIQLAGLETAGGIVGVLVALAALSFAWSLGVFSSGFFAFFVCWVVACLPVFALVAFTSSR